MTSVSRRHRSVSLPSQMVQNAEHKTKGLNCSVSEFTVEITKVFWYRIRFLKVRGPPSSTEVLGVWSQVNESAASVDVLSVLEMR